MNPEGFKKSDATYSFFGSSEPITDFNFEIFKSTKEQRCQLMGIPDTRYVDEYGIERGEAGGCLIIRIGLEPQRFDHLASRIRAGDIDWLNISLGKVDGFYADTVYAYDHDAIKVMPYGGNHLEIQGIEKEEMEKVPTLRGAGDIDLNFGRKDSESQRRNPSFGIPDSET